MPERSVASGLDRRGFLAAGAGAIGLGLVPGVGVGSAAAALSRDAGGDGADDAGPSGETVLGWERLRPGVAARAWVSVGLPTGGNTLVLETGRGPLVIDAKHAYLGRAVWRDARVLVGGREALVSRVPGDTPQAGTLINTHHHADHTGGNWAMRRVLTRVAHENAVPRVREQAGSLITAAASGLTAVRRQAPSRELLSEVAAAASAADRLDVEHFLPTVAVGARSSLADPSADRAVVLHHFGAGHTDNDLVVEIPGLNAVHTGDLCFHGLHPFYDPPAGATTEGWLNSLSRVLELCDAETVVVPGHGAVGDREIVRRQIAYHERLVEAVKKDVAAGKAKADVQATTYPFMEGLEFDQIRPRAIGAVYDEVTAG